MPNPAGTVTPDASSIQDMMEVEGEHKEAPPTPVTPPTPAAAPKVETPTVAASTGDDTVAVVEEPKKFLDRFKDETEARAYYAGLEKEAEIYRKIQPNQTPATQKEAAQAQVDETRFQVSVKKEYAEAMGLPTDDDSLKALNGFASSVIKYSHGLVMKEVKDMLDGELTGRINGRLGEELSGRETQAYFEANNPDLKTDEAEVAKLVVALGTADPALVKDQKKLIDEAVHIYRLRTGKAVKSAATAKLKPTASEGGGGTGGAKAKTAADIDIEDMMAVSI